MSPPRPDRGRTALFVGVTLVLLFGLSLALDRALGLLGFASEVAVGPPPHYERVIENLEFKYTLRTNDRGIRYRTIPLEKPPGVRRVVLLGDSATEAMGVSDEDRWSDRVERFFREREGLRVEMVNCAATGTNPFNYGQKLFHICIDYQPDVVVVAMHMNDVRSMRGNVDPSQMFPGSKTRRSTLFRDVVYRLWPHVYTLYRDKMIYRESRRGRDDVVAATRQEVRKQGIDESLFETWLEMIPESLIEEANAGRINPGLLTYSLTRPDTYRIALDLDTDEARARFETLGRVLGTIFDYCRERNIEVGLILTPSPYQYDPRAPERLQGRLFAAAGVPMRPEWLVKPTTLELELARWTAEREIPFLNLAQTFRKAVRKSDRPLNWELDNHMTPYGHEVAAEAIHRWMLDRESFGSLDRAS